MVAERSDGQAPEGGEPGRGTWFDRLPLFVALAGSLALVALALIVLTVDLPADPSAVGLEGGQEETCMPTRELAGWYDAHPEARVLDAQATEDGRVCLVYVPGGAPSSSA